MNLNNTVAIDFGYTRTKMAYYNTSQEQVQLMELHEDLRYIPTTDVAINRETGAPAVGVEFEGALESELNDKAGKYVIIPGFKTRIEQQIMLDSEKPLEALTAIFTKLWEKAHGHRAFSTEEPIIAYLTHTPLYDKRKTSVLRRAAENAGFKDVRLVEEPQAVIQAFQAEGGTPPKHQLILDCGGWTLDLCYLHGGEPECDPIIKEIGGRDVDAHLIRRFLQRHTDALAAAGVRVLEDIPRLNGASLASVRRQINRCKEEYSSEAGKWNLITVHAPNQQVYLPLEKEDLIESAKIYIDDVYRAVRARIQQINDLKMSKEEDEKRLLIALVGGSSRLRGLKETLEDKLTSEFGDKFEITVSSPSHSTEYATVRGALQPALKPANRRDRPDTVKKVNPNTRSSGDPERFHTGGSQRESTRGRMKEDTIPPPEGMVRIPAGEFQMGSNHKEASEDEKPVHTVYVDAFYMDRFPVTNAQYKAFIDENPEWQKVQAVFEPSKPWFLFARRRTREAYDDAIAEYKAYSERIGKLPAYARDFVILYNYLLPWKEDDFLQKMDNYPVHDVPWYAAMAYAEWAGKRLPTEAEWEYAARGGLEGKRYPWGDKIDVNKANYVDNVNFPSVTKVDTFKPNDYGLYDMCGNVWEWCLDEYDEDFYKKSPKENPLAGRNSIDVVTKTFLSFGSRGLRTKGVLRGGDSNSPKNDVRVSSRWQEYLDSLGSYRSVSPYFGFYHGFRCVKEVDLL